MEASHPEIIPSRTPRWEQEAAGLKDGKAGLEADPRLFSQSPHYRKGYQYGAGVRAWLATNA